MTDLSRLDATAQAELVRKGDVSPLELVDAAINNIEKINPELNAVIHPLFDSARTAAAGELPDGPFRGVPTLFKDLLCRGRGRPGPRGHAVPEERGLALRPHRRARAALSRRRLRVCRSHQHARARDRAHDRAGGVRPDAQSVGHRAVRRAVRAADRRPRSRAAWSRSLTRTTAADRSASPRAAAGSSASSRHADARRSGPTTPRSTTCWWRSCVSRGRCATPPACSTRCTGRTDGETVSAPPPPRPFTQEVGADPGKLRIALLTHNPLDTGEIHPDCVAAAARRRPAARVARPHGGSDVPEVDCEARADRSVHDALDGHTRPQHPLLGTQGRPRSPAPTSWKGSRGRSPRWATRPPAADYVDAQHAMSDLARGVEAWFASGYDLLLTPTLGEPPCPLGRVHDSRRTVPRIHPRRHVRAVHAAGEHGRIARDLAAALVERSGSADRIAADGRVRPRGSPPAGRVAVGNRASVGRSASAGSRLRHPCRRSAIAGGQGFYGDTPTAVDALLAEGVDYLCLEALAELTLAILQKDRQKRRDARLHARSARVPRPRAPVRRRRPHEGHHQRRRHQPRRRHARRDRYGQGDGRHRHQDRDRARRRRAHAARRAARRARASRSRTSTPARRSSRCPRRCSRPRTSGARRSSTRSRRVPTS